MAYTKRDISRDDLACIHCGGTGVEHEKGSPQCWKCGSRDMINRPLYESLYKSA